MPEQKGMMPESEIRAYREINKLEVRTASSESTRTVGGYAVKYNSPELIQTRYGDCWLEEISADAFKNSLLEIKSGRVIKALWNHETGKPIGSTAAGTLRFKEKDSTGLNYDVDLPENSWGNDIYESVKRGDVDGSSFAMRVKKDIWSKVDYEGKTVMKRTITEAELVEVSPCTFPAYNSSEISCRSLESAQNELKKEEILQEAMLFLASMELEDIEGEN